MTVSWLMLEQYALGELDEAERSEIERRLIESSEDRACLDAILNDATVLPPLPTRKPRSKTVWWAVAAAAAIALAFLPRDVPSRRNVSDGVKGSEVAITVISERTGVAAKSFRDGDRFKLFVTCPSFLSRRLSVFVFQGEERYRPLVEASGLQCGNQVAWPGAFALDGRTDVEVCVTWSDQTNPRSARELGSSVVCERLEHE